MPRELPKKDWRDMSQKEYQNYVNSFLDTEIHIKEVKVGNELITIFDKTTPPNKEKIHPLNPK